MLRGAWELAKEALYVHLTGGYQMAKGEEGTTPLPAEGRARSLMGGVAGTVTDGTWLQTSLPNGERLTAVYTDMCSDLEQGPFC